MSKNVQTWDYSMTKVYDADRFLCHNHFDFHRSLEVKMKTTNRQMYNILLAFGYAAKETAKGCFEVEVITAADAG